MEFNEIPEQARNNMEKYLATEYTTHKITECNLVEKTGMKNQYEIYIKGKKNNKSNFFEIYLDEMGNCIKTVEVELKPIQTQN